MIRAGSFFRTKPLPPFPDDDFRSVYGPVVEGIEWIEYRLIAGLEPNPFAQAFWFKAPSALFDLGVMAALWLLFKIKELPPERILIYAWSPLPLIEFWGNGHNDSIAVCFIVLAVALPPKPHGPARAMLRFRSSGLRRSRR